MKPIDPKTVIVLDRSCKFGALCGSDFELHIKDGAKTRMVGNCQKTIWSWMMEGILEMHRVLSDVYPQGEQLLRFAIIDQVGRMLDAEWGEKMMTRKELLEQLKKVDCPIEETEDPLIRTGGLTMAIEALATDTPKQKERHEKVKKENEQKSELDRFVDEISKDELEDNQPRRASLIMFTRFTTDEEIEQLEEEIGQLVVSRNKLAEQPSNKVFRPITRLRVYFVNFYAETENCLVKTRPLRVNPKFPVVKSYVISRKAFHMPAAIHSLLIAAFQMASTTVANIPMKEENKGSLFRSSNYDVELFHQSSSHVQLRQVGVIDDHNRNAFNQVGVTYETMKLTWATTPKCSWNLYPYHQQAYPCTPTEAFSRPAACLTQFVMGGRSVLLDLAKTGRSAKIPCNVAGKYLISHMLMVNSGRIFMHSINFAPFLNRSLKRQIQRPIPLKPVEKQMNMAQFRHVFEQMRLTKLKIPIMNNEPITEEHEKECAFEEAKQRLKKITRNMPVYLEDTMVFQEPVKKHFEPLLTLITKWKLSDVDVENCNANILLLLQKRDQRAPLLSQSFDLPLTCVKNRNDAAEQMRVALIEMARFLANYASSSENHRKIYETFVRELGIDKLVKIEVDDVVPIDTKVKKFDYSYLDDDWESSSEESEDEGSEDEEGSSRRNVSILEKMREEAAPITYPELVKEEGPKTEVPKEVKKKIKAPSKDESSIKKPMEGKPVSIDLMDILCRKLDVEISKTKREFVGREEHGNVAPLYVNLNLTNVAAGSGSATPPVEDRERDRKRVDRGGSGTPPPNAKFPRY